jgi:glycosyltransferase involved in cell wall biosynthesis
VNILLVDLEKEWRGGQNQAFLLLKGLNARGDCAELVTVKGSALGRRAARRRMKVHFVTPRAARISAALKIRALTASGSFDVVHANEAHAVTAAWLAGAYRRAAFVISRRVGYPLAKNALARARYKAAARIVAISQWVAEQLVDSGAPKEKISVVYEGVEIPANPRAQSPHLARMRWGVAGVADDARVARESPVLGSVGVLSPDKGHELLIRALAQLRKEYSGCRLLIAGDGPRRPMLEALAKEFGVHQAVIFAGFVTDIESVYPALDVFLFPSSFEGLGTSLLAAMSFAVPSIAFRCCAFGEIIENEKSGLLVEPGNVEGIVKAVTWLLQNREFARGIGAAGRERITKIFSCDHMVEEMKKVYREVARDKLDSRLANFHPSKPA